ncbi:MAG TPA: hypothetical protein VF838_01790 [Trebonia sp.]
MNGTNKRGVWFIQLDRFFAGSAPAAMPATEAKGKIVSSVGNFRANGWLSRASRRCSILADKAWSGNTAHDGGDRGLIERRRQHPPSLAGSCSRSRPTIAWRTSAGNCMCTLNHTPRLRGTGKDSSFQQVTSTVELTRIAALDGAWNVGGSR